MSAVLVVPVVMKLPSSKAVCVCAGVEVIIPVCVCVCVWCVGGCLCERLCTSVCMCVCVCVCVCVCKCVSVQGTSVCVRGGGVYNIPDGVKVIDSDVDGSCDGVEECGCVLCGALTLGGSGGCLNEREAPPAPR